MKQRLLLLGICLYLATAFSAVAAPKIATKLPFVSERRDFQKVPYRDEYRFWRDYMYRGKGYEYFVQWIDMRLTPPEVAKYYDWFDSGDVRAFDVEETGLLLATEIFGDEDSKVLLYTLKKDRSFIDGITVGAIFWSNDAIYDDRRNSSAYYELLQYEITSDLQVVVYQLCPISNVPMIAEDLYYYDFTKGMLAQRIDRVYQIDKDGYFHQVSETRYIPQTYTNYQMLSHFYNIWEGYETVQWWYEPDFAYRPPYRTVW